MKKLVVIITTIIIGGIAYIVINNKNSISPSKSPAYTIGILQTASHPALDAVREGFIEELKNLTNHTVNFIIQNGEGSIPNIHAIAQRFHINKQLDGFLVIATPAAQSLSMVEKERPIFIAAVTDPQALGIIHPKTNICGTQDMIDIKSTIEMLIQLIPNTKKVGILYAAGETNSISLVKQMHKELEARGLIPIDFAITGEHEIVPVVELACRKSDVILAPTDNMVAATITLIAKIVTAHKKPLIVSDNMLIKQGALAARGVDYFTSGKQTAQIAYKVLVENKKPYELPIEQAKSETIVINQKTLEILGLTVPKTLPVTMI